jgi:hypothetical protein
LEQRGWLSEYSRSGLRASLYWRDILENGTASKRPESLWRRIAPDERPFENDKYCFSTRGCMKHGYLAAEQRLFLQRL